MEEHTQVTCLGMPPRVTDVSQVKDREAIHWNTVVTQLFPHGG